MENPEWTFWPTEYNEEDKLKGLVVMDKSVLDFL